MVLQYYKTTQQHQSTENIKEHMKLKLDKIEEQIADKTDLIQTINPATEKETDRKFTSLQTNLELKLNKTKEQDKIPAEIKVIVVNY